MQIVFLFYDGMTALDAIGPHEILCRLVEDGKIMTAAGVSAGIDMALTLATRLASPIVAQSLQLGIEYDPNPPFDVGSPKKVNPAIVEALRNRLTASFEKSV